jgi:hypothetical protein
MARLTGQKEQVEGKKRILDDRVERLNRRLETARTNAMWKEERNQAMENMKAAQSSEASARQSCDNLQRRSTEQRSQLEKAGFLAAHVGHGRGTSTRRFSQLPAQSWELRWMWVARVIAKREQMLTFQRLIGYVMFMVLASLWRCRFAFPDGALRALSTACNRLR